MPKHKTKTLIIEDGDPQEDGDEMNPFSFKEFIRNKNQHPDVTADSDGKKYKGQKKIYGSEFPEKEEYASPTNFHQDFRDHFFMDPSPFPQSLENDTDWIESYQPSAAEEAHRFGLCGAVDSTEYSGHLALSREEQKESASLWEDDVKYPPEDHQFRNSSGRYEMDHDTSIGSYRNPEKIQLENGSWDQIKLKEENTQLRKRVLELMTKSNQDSKSIEYLTEQLRTKRLQELSDVQSLETMVHSVEQNLQQMTKRAIKAESSVSKLKQEIQQLQSQLQECRSENERFRAGETAALNTIKHNAQVASEYLNTAVRNAETSIKQLLSGAETLCLASQLLQTIDNLSEVQNES